MPEFPRHAAISAEVFDANADMAGRADAGSVEVDAPAEGPENRKLASRSDWRTDWRTRDAALLASNRPKNAETPWERGFPSAAEWSRTITGVSTHKALNLARLPVPPQPLEGGRF